MSTGMMEERSTKLDMEAAQQLVQLSGGEEEESKGLEHSDHSKKKKKEEEKEEEVSRAEIPRRGKEEEVEEEDKHPPRKRKRFRSLESIYKVSKPISDGHRGSRKKRLQRGKEKGLGD